MQDLNDKVTGGTLTAAEWNEVPSELQNVIEGLGITLSGADLNQLGKALAGYVANGTFYADSGAADVYVLATIGAKQSLTAYTDGASFEFVAANPNTGASTVNVAALGVKNIKLADGTDPAAGQIAGRTTLKFVSSNDRCELIQSGGSNIVVKSSSGTYNPSPGTKGIKFYVTGAGGGGGGVDGQGAGTAALGAGGSAGGTGILATTNIEISYTITIGAGGTGGVGTAGGTGGAGGNTIVSSSAVTITANGGGGGAGLVATSGDGGALPSDTGGTVTGGDLNLTGNGGNNSVIIAGKRTTYGYGAGSFWGGGVRGKGSTVGTNGQAFGAGGGGAGVTIVADDNAGGNGVDGVVIIEESF